MQAFTFDDILLVPTFNDIASRRDVTLSVSDVTRKLTLDLPVFSANMDTVTESAMCQFVRKHGGMGVLHRFMTVADNVAEFQKFNDCFVSVGTSEQEVSRFYALKAAGAEKFCVDVAHGHSKATGDMVHLIRKEMGRNAIIIAGNVCTADGAEYLADHGADIIKVGIGPSPVCRTRGATGFGYPQLSAIENCSKVDRSIIADGGIKKPGDIVKALAFGADFVMLGSMLAGTHYTPGEKSDHFRLEANLSRTYFKKYRGMASREANEEFFGVLPEWKTAEGVATTIPYKDEQQTEMIMQDIKGGLRSGLTYCGAHNIHQLQSKMEYTFISESSKSENKTVLD